MSRESVPPEVLDRSLVGTYPVPAKSGGGYVWDAVLEYRDWCHPERGAPDEAQGDDYFHAFDSFEKAQALARATAGAEQPLALVLQESSLTSRKRVTTFTSRSVA